jgi:uncharacterized protein YciI
VKYVLFYESADVMSNAPEHFPAHQAHYTAFRDQRTLLLLGAFGDPQAEGSMAVFTTREAAEQFAADAPSSARASFATSPSERGTKCSPPSKGAQRNDQACRQRKHTTESG